MQPTNLSKRLFAEALGTALLIISVVGSGIMATNLTDDVALQLLANAGATVGALIALILMFGPISGAHFNPVVTAAFPNRSTPKQSKLPTRSSQWAAAILARSFRASTMKTGRSKTQRV